MRKSWLRTEGSSFVEIPARHIIDAIADTAERWCDADFPPRVRAVRAIEERTGYSEPVIDYALDRLFGGLGRADLRAAIAGELGSIDALDGFVRRNGRPDGIARGIGHVVIVASDTTIGVALPPALFALCARCSVVVRDRSDALVRAFAETLREERADVAAHLRVLDPVAHDDAEWAAELSRADAVVVFGGSNAVRALHGRVSPEANFVAFGHRTSVAYLEREALSSEHGAGELAEYLARDAFLYDGEGCLSVHAAFVERGAAVSIGRFHDLLRSASERITIEFPPGGFTAPASVIAYRDAARFREALGQGGASWGPAGAHLLVRDPPREEPPPLLPRTLATYAVDGPDELLRFTQLHALPLEAVALAVLPGRDDVAAHALATGAARIARIGDLQRPSFAGEHGGIGRVAPFVRWVTRDS